MSFLRLKAGKTSRLARQVESPVFYPHLRLSSQKVEESFMRPFFPKKLTLFAFFAAALTASAVDDYKPGPDSFPQPGVPVGEVKKYSFENSKIFPGTVRNYWIYVPRQYDPARPACLYVNQDGVQFKAPAVFDNLIARHEMPVTIGVFVMLGG